MDPGWKGFTCFPHLILYLYSFWIKVIIKGGKLRVARLQNMSRGNVITLTSWVKDWLWSLFVGPQKVGRLSKILYSIMQHLKDNYIDYRAPAVCIIHWGQISAKITLLKGQCQDIFEFFFCQKTPPGPYAYEQAKTVSRNFPFSSRYSRKTCVRVLMSVFLPGRIFQGR